jgi:hypothetical protein
MASNYINLANNNILNLQILTVWQIILAMRKMTPLRLPSAPIVRLVQELTKARGEYCTSGAKSSFVINIASDNVSGFTSYFRN